MKLLKNLKLIFCLSGIISLCSCETIDDKIIGNWDVQECYINGNPATWDLYSSTFCLFKDKTCELPIYKPEQNNSDYSKGQWTTLKQNGNMFLKISTINIVFNRTFKIVEFVENPKEIGNKNLTRMILESDSVRFVCYRLKF